MDYFEIYEQILLTVRDESPRDGYALIKSMNRKPVIIDSLEKGEDKKLLAQVTIETLENLIEEGLIKGKVLKTKDGKFYSIDLLTTAGHVYLQKIKKLTFKEKMKKVFQEEGVPITPQALTKFIAKLL